MFPMLHVTSRQYRAHTLQVMAPIKFRDGSTSRGPFRDTVTGCFRCTHELIKRRCHLGIAHENDYVSCLGINILPFYFASRP